jgi:hypothetical protein
MAMNRIQFQAGLPLTELLEQYSTEAKCRRALYRWRWPQGFRWPASGDRRRSSFRRACQHQSSLISGTLLASTKLPLTT